MNYRIFAATFIISLTICFAQDKTAVPDPPKSAKLEPLPTRPDGKSRVFVGESEMFYSSSFYSSGVSGSAAGNLAKVVGASGGASAAGVMKFTINVMKALHDFCPDKAVVVSSPEAADYFLRLDTDGVLIIRAKMVAFDRYGEMSFVGSTLSISKDVKRFCITLPDTSSTPPEKGNKAPANPK